MREVTEISPDYKPVLKKVLNNLKYHQRHRIPTEELDYGDDKTIGLHIKLIGKGIGDEGWKGGVFGGKTSDGKFIIVRYGVFEFEAIELFDTEEEMKKKWRLD